MLNHKITGANYFLPLRRVSCGYACHYLVYTEAGAAFSPSSDLVQPRCCFRVVRLYAVGFLAALAFMLARRGCCLTISLGGVSAIDKC